MTDDIDAQIDELFPEAINCPEERLRVYQGMFNLCLTKYRHEFTEQQLMLFDSVIKSVDTLIFQGKGDEAVVLLKNGMKRFRL